MAKPVKTDFISRNHHIRYKLSRLRNHLINFIIFWGVILVMILAQWLDSAG